MGWRCRICESFNSEENIICEVCDSIYPILAMFDYSYEGTNKGIIKWHAENALKVVDLFNSYEYDIPNWMSARVTLNDTLTKVVLVLLNEVITRVYIFGIPKQ